MSNWVRFGILIAVVASSQTGCKTGWKMPGADMFSWSRKPSESTLTGAGPSIPSPSSIPQSPALKSTPNQISNLSPSQRQVSPYGTSGMSTAANAAPTGAGAAATANGYVTGPYQTNNQKLAGGTPPTPYAPSGFAPPTNPNNVGAAPSYAVAPAGQSAPTGYGNLPPTPNGVPNYGAPATSGAVATNLPPTSYGAPSYNPVGAAGVPAMTAGYNNAGLPPTNGNLSSMPIASGNAQANGLNSLPPQSASTAAYQPGSVKRQTGYDFSNQGQGAVNPGTNAYPSYQGNAYPRTANEYQGTVNR